jgi:hypothetical protein
MPILDFRSLACDEMSAECVFDLPAILPVGGILPLV